MLVDGFSSYVTPSHYLLIIFLQDHYDHTVIPLDRIFILSLLWKNC
jgi:hypothetical protein